MLNRRCLIASLGAAASLPMGPVHAATGGWDAALDRAFETGGVPALAGLVVGSEGAIWTSAKGVRRLGGSAEATADDLWHLGSNTKAMTAAVFGRLVDQGRAAWDAPLSSLLPDVVMHPLWRSVPILAFMGHVAGLTDATALGGPWLMTAHQDPRPLTAQRQALVERMLVAGPSGTPGMFAYANSNYVLLGAVIEHIAGQSWEEVMRAEMFGPLQMRSAGFGAPTGDQPRGHRGAQSVDPATPGSDNPPALGPAGTVHMSLADYARFLRIFLSDETAWISAGTRAVLTRPVGVGPPPYAGGWIVAEGQPWASGPALTHDGSNTFWYASAWIAPGIGRAFVAVSNDGQAGRAACQALIPGLIRAA